MRLYIWPQLKKKSSDSKSLLLDYSVAKPTPEHLFGPQGQNFFHFNEASHLLWASNLTSYSGLFYLMCSALGFKLKVYSYTFYFLYSNDFWSIDRDRFCLALFFCVFSSSFWKYSPYSLPNTDTELHETHNFWCEILGSPYSLWQQQHL